MDGQSTWSAPPAQGQATRPREGCGHGPSIDQLLACPDTQPSEPQAIQRGVSAICCTPVFLQLFPRLCFTGLAGDTTERRAKLEL